MGQKKAPLTEIFLIGPPLHFRGREVELSAELDSATALIRQLQVENKALCDQDRMKLADEMVKFLVENGQVSSARNGEIAAKAAAPEALRLHEDVADAEEDDEEDEDGRPSLEYVPRHAAEASGRRSSSSEEYEEHLSNFSMK